MYRIPKLTRRVNMNDELKMMYRKNHLERRRFYTLLLICDLVVN